MKKAIICLGLGIAAVESKTFLKCAEDKSCGANTVALPIVASQQSDCGCGSNNNVAAFNNDNDCGCDDNVSRPGCTSFGEIAGGCFGNQNSGNNMVASSNIIANGQQNAFQYGLNGFTAQEAADTQTNAIPEIQEVRLPGERQRPVRQYRNEVEESDECDTNLPESRVSRPNQQVYLSTDQNDRTLQASNNNNYANTVGNAAKQGYTAGQAANNNYSNQASQADSAQLKRAAAQNCSDEEIKNSNRAKNSAALKYNNCNSKKNLQKKNNVCHAKDNAFHKEEHVANEQKFCHQDEGNVETLECTHICENTFKDKCNNEKADRQIWKKVETCASKCNHKKASAKALHKACHKKSDKNAYKSAKNCHDQDCNESKSQDAKSGKTRDECDSSDKESSAASSNNAAASSNTANSAIVNNAASSANSDLNAASSNNFALSQNIASQVAGTNNKQSTTPIVTENNDCGC